MQVAGTGAFSQSRPRSADGQVHPEEGEGGGTGLRPNGPGQRVIMDAPVSVCHQVSIIGQLESPTTRGTRSMPPG